MQWSAVSAVLSVFTPLLPSALAQDVGPTVPQQLFVHEGDDRIDEFGADVALAGDVDRDGFQDLIVGAPLDDDTGFNAGSARVLSGRSGAVLHDFRGLGRRDLFGGSVDGAGDVDGDGFADLIVGASGADPNGSNSGSAYVFSGATGALLLAFHGDSEEDNLGVSVAGVGDLDGDGRADVLVGAPRDDRNGPNSGAVYVHSGANGALLWTFVGDSPGDVFGWAARGAGDVDGDGCPDVVIGAQGDDDNGSSSGSARVHSGATGAALFTVHGDAAGDYLGYSVAGAGDVDGDGRADVIVGAWGDDDNGSSSGSARVISGRTGGVLFTLHGRAAYAWFGEAVGAAGDVNGDGLDDVIVGAEFAANSAYVFAGPLGELLYVVSGESHEDKCGSAVGSAGDVNGDGFADFFAASRGFDDLRGKVRIFGHALGSSGTALCRADPSSTGLRATLGASSPSGFVATANDLTLTVAQLPSGALAAMLVGDAFGVVLNPVIGGVPSDGRLCIARGRLGRYRELFAGPGTTWHLPLDLSALPFPPAPPYSVAARAGETWYWQCWYRDPGAAGRINFSDAVHVELR